MTAVYIDVLFIAGTSFYLWKLRIWATIHCNGSFYVTVFVHFAAYRHAKVLEALTFCSEIRNCERFVPILQGLNTNDVQMKVCSVTVKFVFITYAQQVMFLPRSACCFLCSVYQQDYWKVMDGLLWNFLTCMPWDRIRSVISGVIS